MVSWLDSIARGFADALIAAGIRTVGPSAAASQIETSKAFGREFCIRHGVSVPKHHVCKTVSEAAHALKSWNEGVVVKADGVVSEGEGSRYL